MNKSRFTGSQIMDAIKRGEGTSAGARDMQGAEHRLGPLL